MSSCHCKPVAASQCSETSSNARIMQTTAERMGDQFSSNQILGRIHTIGCVAVEITQKCNLDCTLCYLSEHSQSVKDIPLEEVFRRLDDALTHYGKGTHVQITGGDPTLRKHTELVEIVKYARDIGLYPALFTNGIAATRPLLKRLAKVGLCDVAFHVDITQERKDGETEAALNVIRREYIARARGLGLQVMFNTTVHKENFHEVPKLVEFFTQNAGDVNLASFQLQADTGRGVLRERDVIISHDTVRQQINVAAQRVLPWDSLQVGHSDCHSYLPTWVINRKVFPLLPDKAFFASFLKDFSHISWDRVAGGASVLAQFLPALLVRPKWWFKGVGFVVKHLKETLPDIIKARGQVNRLTFFVQNFMDASALEEDRVHACSFMVMTTEGPISMCEHNSRRDDFILQPIKFVDAEGKAASYEPLPKTALKPDVKTVPAA